MKQQVAENCTTLEPKEYLCWRTHLLNVKRVLDGERHEEREHFGGERVLRDAELLVLERHLVHAEDGHEDGRLAATGGGDLTQRRQHLVQHEPPVEQLEHLAETY